MTIVTFPAPKAAPTEAPMLDLASAEAVMRAPDSSYDEVIAACDVLRHSPDPMHRVMAHAALVTNCAINSALLDALERKGNPAPEPIPVIDFASPVCQRRAEIEAFDDFTQEYT